MDMELLGQEVTKKGHVLKVLGAGHITVWASGSP